MKASAISRASLILTEPNTRFLFLFPFAKFSKVGLILSHAAHEGYQKSTITPW